MGRVWDSLYGLKMKKYRTLWVVNQIRCEKPNDHTTHESNCFIKGWGDSRAEVGGVRNALLEIDGLEIFSGDFELVNDAVHGKIMECDIYLDNFLTPEAVHFICKTRGG